VDKRSEGTIIHELAQCHNAKFPNVKGFELAKITRECVSLDEQQHPTRPANNGLTHFEAAQDSVSASDSLERVTALASYIFLGANYSLGTLKGAVAPIH
jgi:hypothetical protein